MSYVEAILKICQEQKVSWTKWGLRPGTLYGDGNCQQNDIEDNGELIKMNDQNLGADLYDLFPKYY